MVHGEGVGRPTPDEIVVSVLLPTRQRVTLMRESVASLLATATAPASVEVLLAVDRDDAETLAALPTLPVAVRSIVVPRFGFPQLHEYFNLQARIARGRWLLIWNDDKIMESAGWDQVLAETPPCVGWLASNQRWNTSPAVPRAWTELVGHVALQLHVDSWWNHVGRFSGYRRQLPITFTHHRFDLTQENNDPGFRSRAYDRVTFDSPEVQALVRHDAAQIKQAMQAQGIVAPPWTEPA